MKRFAIFAAAAAMILGLTACGKEAAPEPPESIQIFAMDTVMNLTVYGDRAAEANQYAERILEELEAKLSRTDENSTVSHLNEADGQAVYVDAAVIRLLEAAEKYSADTDGALDITIAPVADAWGFTKEAHQVPTQEILDGLLETLGMEHIHLAGDAVSLDTGTQIDLGAIAKGYASDLMEAHMRKYGVERGIVELGGNVFLLGEKEDETAWRVGVKDPNHVEQICGILNLKDAFAITSGGYQRNFEENGIVYHHIIDPATGYPAQSGLLSVTVVAPANGSDYLELEAGNGTMCDAFSTALFVMGEEKALDFWRNSNYEFELVLVTEDGRVVTTAGLEEQFTPVEESGYIYETVA